MQSAVTIPQRDQQFAVADVTRVPQTGLRGVAICLAAVVAMLVDGTAANAISSALPYLQGVSAATPDEGSWIISVFNAAYYSTILFSPWLYARLGRKPLLLAALLGFGVISLALAATQPLGWVVALRFLQGICLGAVFVPAAVLLFTSLPLSLLPFAPPFFAVVVLGAGVMGTLLGGFVSENYGGSAVYLPSAVAALVVAAVVYVAAPNLDAPQRELRPDVVGFTLSLVAFTAMQYLANDGERRDWFSDASVVAAAMVLVVAAPAFVLWELRATRPHVNFLLLVQKRNLAVGAAVNVVLGTVGYSIATFVLYLETQIEATATLAGEMIILRFATYIVGIVMAFGLVKRGILNVRAVICIAALGSAAAFVAFAFSMTTTAEAATFVAVSLVFGLFFSMLSQPVPALVLGSLGLADLAAGLSMYKVSAPVGLMIGTGAFQTLLDHRNALHVSELGASITRAHPPVAQYLQRGGTIPTLATIVGGQGQSLAFADAMIGFAVLVVLTVPLIFLADVRPGPRR